MKYPVTKTVANAGGIFVQKTVNEHSSIFHPVHQENDLGVDGVIELVKSVESSGHLVAIQIKSGESYFPNSGDEFVMPVDQPPRLLAKLCFACDCNWTLTTQEHCSLDFSPRVRPHGAQFLQRP